MPWPTNTTSPCTWTRASLYPRERHHVVEVAIGLARHAQREAAARRSTRRSAPAESRCRSRRPARARCTASCVARYSAASVPPRVDGARPSNRSCDSSLRCALIDAFRDLRLRRPRGAAGAGGDAEAGAGDEHTDWQARATAHQLSISQRHGSRGALRGCRFAASPLQAGSPLSRPRAVTQIAAARPNGRALQAAKPPNLQPRSAKLRAGEPAVVRLVDILRTAAARSR